MELNDYMEVKNNVIYIRVAPDWEDAKPSKKKVKMSDVVSYFARYSGSRGFMASYRTLGEIGGDWRPIDPKSSSFVSSLMECPFKNSSFTVLNPILHS